ncbi:hypothetical protein OSB04_001659 [Centaurea solstitialis]|uniref:F-box domain-containing protein n=1 Tax=Centaurea solstitialis TaxID=347529 RepID=A0AA38TRD8_9ASTR|nr:hypothetical protein OSB04_001659 [Centaurea solstitialis]
MKTLNISSKQKTENENSTPIFENDCMSIVRKSLRPICKGKREWLMISELKGLFSEEINPAKLAYFLIGYNVNIERSLTMSESRNWLQMPDEIMGEMILQRLGAVQILMSVQKVCTTWRRICKDPTMWKIIGLMAVHRSCGELIDITLYFDETNDDLRDHISRLALDEPPSGHLVGLSPRAFEISEPALLLRYYGLGVKCAVKRLSHLETLELSNIYIHAEDIEVLGRNCPQLKSFTMNRRFLDCNADAHTYAIANSMPGLRHLNLTGTLGTDDGVQAILHVYLDGNLEKLCKERIKDFKYKRDNIPEANEDSEIDDFYDDDDPLGDYGVSGGSDISAGDDYD